MIELLVATAVIALLISLAAGGFAKARRGAKRAACGANLRQAGVALTGYLMTNNDILPAVSLLPSVDPLPVDGPSIYLPDVIGDYVDGVDGVFACPSDTPGISQREGSSADKSYFDTERSSYQFRSYLSGYSMHVITNQYRRWIDESTSTNSIWLIRDYDNFHGEPGGSGARNYLYSDGHVEDFERY